MKRLILALVLLLTTPAIAQEINAPYLQIVTWRAPNASTPGVLAMRDGHPLTVFEVCGTRWGLDHRHVTEAMKRATATNYGLHREDVKPKGQGLCCEWDHLIPRELGGADDVANLWPQPWGDAKKKDREENRLHRAVCAGTVMLADTQEQMRNWNKALATFIVDSDGKIH